MPRPVVVLHPLGSDRDFWAPVREHLSDRDVFALDIAGHGSAPQLPLNAHIDVPAGQLISELESRLTGPVDLIGVSLGGLLAQRVAVTHPALVHRLVLADTVTRYPEPMRRMWADRAETARSVGMEPIIAPTLGLWFTEDFARARGPVVRRCEQSLREMPGEAYARACELLIGVDLDADAPRIAAPTLVVCGERDGQVFLDAAPRLRDRIPHSRLDWLPGAHAAAVEHPAEFARVVRAFLDDTPGPAQGDSS
ncbi:alpha/beta fold hydrolase [Microbacterium sp. RD1]|uniref:alpha/beta fold hydrolase n=1 Tax=Microbacterium sp. RD1 TaxID=3457313 RepID=UPI003FA59CC6